MADRRSFLKSLTSATAIASLRTPLSMVTAQSRAITGVKPGEERAIDLVRLCWCPPGKFNMGSPAEETGRRFDEAQVPVTISRGFWTGKFEITQGEWRRVMGDLPARKPSAEFGQGDDFPVYWVSFIDAEAFCRALTERARRAAGALRRVGSSGSPPKRSGSTPAVPARRPPRLSASNSASTRRTSGATPRTAAEAVRRASRHAVGSLSRQPVGHLRHARQRLRVVPRLVPLATAGRHRSGRV